MSRPAAVAALIGWGLFACEPVDSGVVIADGGDTGLASETAPEPVEPVAAGPAGVPVEGAGDGWILRFAQGGSLFEHWFGEDEGLGPLYIEGSCSTCHENGVSGPSDVQKMVVMCPDCTAPSADQSALPWGATVRENTAGGATTPIVPPWGTEGLVVTTRVPPAVIGRGYVEAVRDDEIERIAAEQAAAGGRISGRVHYVPWSSEQNPDATFHTNRRGDRLIGRFGLKARVPTVDEFVADAFQGDMSMTSPLRPTEAANPDGLTDDFLPGADLGADEVNLVAAYVRMLDIPRRATPDADGERLFGAIGCDTCHVPSLRTRADYPIAPLADIDAPIFTDLLLHDMGPALADGLVDVDAQAYEWKTPPLVGLRFHDGFMHDGRALTVEEAIVLHGGEGSEAAGVAAAFQALDAADRAALIRYVESL